MLYTKLLQMNEFYLHFLLQYSYERLKSVKSLLSKGQYCVISNKLNRANDKTYNVHILIRIESLNGNNV